MPLSEHEQQLLDRLEQQFQEEDPKFAKSLEPEPARTLSTRRILIGALVTVAGFLLLFLGATRQDAAQNIIVGVLGFAVMIAGVYLATVTAPALHNRPPAAAGGKSKPPKGPKANRERRFFKNGIGDAAFWSLFLWL